MGNTTSVMDFQNFDSTKTYKTVDALLKAIEANHLDQLRYLIVKVANGKNVDRFTAIFNLAGGNGMPAAHAGFKVMG